MIHQIVKGVLIVILFDIIKKLYVLPDEDQRNDKAILTMKSILQ